MKDITFGKLLEKLLYLSNQKKSTLARELGYDVSYISKWISSKNLPSAKNINRICKNISNFIVKSLNKSSIEELSIYFELEVEVDEKEFLLKYIEHNLKEAYLNTLSRGVQKIPKTTYSEERYNTYSAVKPRLMRKNVLDELNSYANKDDDLDITISLNLFDIGKEDKMSFADLKKVFYPLSKSTNLKVRLLLGFSGENTDIAFNALLIINMLSEYPSVNFEIYNCNINSNTSIIIVKDKFIFNSIFTKEGHGLISNMSKEKKLVEELYFNMNDILKSKGKILSEKKSPKSLIEEKNYMQYIMGKDLRWLIGSINELFMPPELFIEIAQQVFGNQDKVMQELKKINILLQNVTYKSSLKVLIYESEIRQYLSSGKLYFFNIPVVLNFKQREKHIEYIEKILRDSEDVEIKLIDGNYVEDFKNNLNPSLYLSKSFKFTKVHPIEDVNDYLIIINNQFKEICDELFDLIWNENNNIVIYDRQEIISRISEALNYTRIINENLLDNME